MKKKALFFALRFYYWDYLQHCASPVKNMTLRVLGVFDEKGGNIPKY